MNAEQVAVMQAGPEMDLLIARHVMGMSAAWTVAEMLAVADNGYPYVARGVEDGQNCMLLYTRSDGVHRWSPSTDIAAAFAVAESFGCFYTVSKLAKETLAEKYIATIVCGASTVDGWADTAPLAICRAALKSIAA